MMLLTVTPTYNHITDKEDGESVGLIPLNLQGIIRIEEDTETKFANIYYTTNQMIVTKTPFIAILDFLNRQGLVETLGGEVKCGILSQEVHNYYNPK